MMMRKNYMGKQYHQYEHWSCGCGLRPQIGVGTRQPSWILKSRQLPNCPLFYSKGNVSDPRLIVRVFQIVSIDTIFRHFGVYFCSRGINKRYGIQCESLWNQWNPKIQHMKQFHNYRRKQFSQPYSEFKKRGQFGF